MIKNLAIQTPSRLHFGLLSWGEAMPRQFGGVGLLVRDPGLQLNATPSPGWHAAGPLASRVLAVAERVAGRLADQGVIVDPLRFVVESAPPEHVGLGVGTQLGMAVARIMSEFAGQPAPTTVDLARLAGRGLRSGIGLHGFAHGGLIVDGGRARGEFAPLAPLLARLAFPPEWSVLVVIPPDSTGIHGEREIRAFRQIPALPDSTVDRLCRLVLLELLPAVLEQDLTGFGSALTEIQFLVGQGFAPAQGGVFARPDLDQFVGFLRSEGLVGVGQSSWGPTLYGFMNAPVDRRLAILGQIHDRTGWPPGSAFWTVASPGATSSRSE